MGRGWLSRRRSATDSSKKPSTSGNTGRVGVITELRHNDGSPPHQVRWLDAGHEASVYPGLDARIEPADATDEPR